MTENTFAVGDLVRKGNGKVIYRIHAVVDFGDAGIRYTVSKASNTNPGNGNGGLFACELTKV